MNTGVFQWCTLEFMKVTFKNYFKIEIINKLVTLKENVKCAFTLIRSVLSLKIRGVADVEMMNCTEIAQVHSTYVNRNGSSDKSIKGFRGYSGHGLLLIDRVDVSGC